MKCFIRTYTGKEVNPLDLRPEDIDILDIAHALAVVPRFAGHTKKPISVAQHSVYVSRLVDPFGESLKGLLHDAPEAYLGDVTKWLKQTDAMAGYRDAEERAAKVIAGVFGLDDLWSEHVERADRVMVRFEGMQGFGKDFTIDHPSYPPLTETEIMAVGMWAPWPWKSAEELFLTTFRLTRDAKQFGFDGYPAIK